MVVLNRGPLRLSRNAGSIVLAILVAAGGGPVAAGPESDGGPAEDLVSRFSSLGHEEKREAALQMLDQAIYADLVATAVRGEDPPARPDWTLGDLQESLSSTTGLLALHPTGDVVCAALVLQRRVQVKVFEAPAVAASANRLQAWLADPAAHPFDPAAAWELQRLLVAPFRRGLQGLKRLVIVASGCLRDLPVECFLLVEPLEPPSGPPAYLVHRYEVSYEPTLGSRLAWDADASSELLWRREEPERPPALRALAEIRAGVRGVLVFRDGEDLEEWRRSFAAERDGERRRDVTALRRLKLARLRVHPEEPAENWALWLLYGSP